MTLSTKTIVKGPKNLCTKWCNYGAKWQSAPPPPPPPKEKQTNKVYRPAKICQRQWIKKRKFELCQNSSFI